MAAPFDAFTDALEALCVEHGIRITGSRDYDDYSVYLEVATAKEPAGCDIGFVECIPLTPEEQAESDRLEEEELARQKVEAAHYDELMRKRMEWAASPEFAAQYAENQRQANITRESSMRVTRIPGDHNNIGDRPCRVFCNEVEVTGWTVADDFRRVVETPGKVHHGAVRIDLTVDAAPATAIEPSGLHGVFVHVPDAPPVVEAPAEPAPTFAAPAIKAAPKHIPARKRKAGK